MELTQINLFGTLQDLNESLKVGLVYKDTAENYSDVFLKNEIMEIIESGLLDDSSTVNQETVDVLLEMAIDVPAGMKIRKEKVAPVGVDADSVNGIDPDESIIEDEDIVEEMEDVSDEPIQIVKEELKCKPAVASKRSKPGVLNSMFEYVKSAGRIVSTNEILDYLTIEFPDRNPAGMKKTIGILAIRAQKKGINIIKNKEGFLYQ